LKLKIDQYPEIIIKTIFSKFKTLNLGERKAINNVSIQKLNIAEFRDLIRKGEVLISDSAGEIIVFLTPDGDIIKKFPYKEKYLSRLFPRALRFQKNCKKLTALGFKTMTVKSMFDFPDNRCHVVIYPMIAGETLSDYLGDKTKESLKQDLLMRAAAYYGKLHEKGVYCRPSHFRNVIVCPDSEFALIDVQNIRFRWFSLDLRTCSRNFRYILKYRENLNQVIGAGAKEFFDHYMSECRMVKRKQKIFLALLRHNVPALFKNGKDRRFQDAAIE